MVFQKSPDGGWGWMIVLVSFFTQFLCYGSPLAVGVLYLEWLDIFGEGKGKTAWVGSLASGVGLLASPICSTCVSAFGARSVTIFSAFMVAGGLMMSSFAPNIYFLFCSYGIIVGLGCGLLYTATVTITCQYFDKRRGLALGLISTGSSVGLFIYAALQRELIELYGLDGCLLIVGALSLNILACGSLMRPLQPCGAALPEKPNLEKVPDQYLIYNGKENNVYEENINILENASNEGKDGSKTSCGDCKQDSLITKNRLLSITPRETDTYKKKVVERTYFCKQLAKKKWHLYLDYWEETIGLFKNKVFSSLFIAIFFFDIGGFPPSLLMEDIARSSNIGEEDCVIPLISIIGIMTAIGKLVLGILADFDWINTLYLYVLTLIMTAVALVLIPFAQTYITLAILSGVLGFLAGNWSIFPYVTTKTVGIEKLTHAYGILMFFAGLGNSLGPPIVGWFYDWTKSYDIAFYFSGLCVLFGGLLLLVATLPCWNSVNSSNQPEKPLPNIYACKVASGVFDPEPHAWMKHPFLAVADEATSAKRAFANNQKALLVPRGYIAELQRIQGLSMYALILMCKTTSLGFSIGVLDGDTCVEY